MDELRFDHLVRVFGSHTRRTLLSLVAGVMTAPLGHFAAEARQKHRKHKNGNRHQKAHGKHQVKSSTRKCRGEGHPCEGNQTCCDGLTCTVSEPGSAKRCTACPSGTVFLNGTCCTPDNDATCAGKECGNAVNNCEQTVTCGAGCVAGEECVDGTCTSTCVGFRETCDPSDECCGGNVCCNCGGLEPCSGNSVVPICRDPRNIEYYFDPANCGACGNACDNGLDGEECISSIPPVNLPNGECLDDGTCSGPCPAGQSCDNGNCVTDPSRCGNAHCVKCSDRSPDLRYCRQPDQLFGNCRNIKVDAQSCGECFHECAAGEVCIDGVCV